MEQIRRTFIVGYLAVTCVAPHGVARAQSAVASLPSPDSRWAILTEGAQFDTETFRVSTHKSKGGSDQRLTEVWIRFIDQDGQLAMSKWVINCADRTGGVTEQVIKRSDGTEQRIKRYQRLQLNPGSEWEADFNGLCKRSKKWWQLW